MKTIKLNDFPTVAMNDAEKIAKGFVYKNAEIREKKKGITNSELVDFFNSCEFVDATDTDFGYCLVRFDLYSVPAKDRGTYRANVMSQLAEKGITVTKPEIVGADSSDLAIWAIAESERESVGRIAYVNAENFKAITTWINKNYSSVCENLNSFDRGFFGVMTKLGSYHAKNSGKLPNDYDAFDNWIVAEELRKTPVPVTLDRETVSA